MSKVYASIKAIRTAKNLKQEDVAKKMGIAQSNYGRLEKGLTQVTIERLEQLAEIFEMSVESILSYETGQDSDREDTSYYINLCRKYEKQVETLKKRVNELEEENINDWGSKNDELKASKEKVKHFTERIKEKDNTIRLLEIAINALSERKKSDIL